MEEVGGRAGWRFREGRRRVRVGQGREGRERGGDSEEEEINWLPRRSTTQAGSADTPAHPFYTSPSVRPSVRPSARPSIPPSIHPFMHACVYMCI